MNHATTKIARRLKSAGPESVDSRLRWLLIGGMALAVLALLLHGVLAEPQVRENFTNSRSPSPGGHRALVELLSRSGFTVESTTDRLDRLDESFFKRGGRALALLEPSRRHVQDHWSELAALFADERNACVILALPKRRYTQLHHDGDDVVLEESIVPVSECNELLKLARLDGDLQFHRVATESILYDAEHRNGVTLGPAGSVLQHFSIRDRDMLSATHIDKARGRVPRVEVLVEDSSRNPVALRFNDRNLVVLADPDILSNRFIGLGDAATLAKSVMGSGGTRNVAIDETMHGLSAPVSLEYLAVRPPAVWALLSLLLLLGLFYWREAAVVRPFAAQTDARRSRALVIEGVAKLMARARDFGSAAQALIRRAPFALGASRASVHTAGMAGSTASGLTREMEQRLNAITYAGGTEEGLVQAAAAVARLKVEQALTVHIPARTS